MGRWPGSSPDAGGTWSACTATPPGASSGGRSSPRWTGSGCVSSPRISSAAAGAHKPRAVAWHTLDRHAAALSAWMEARRLVDPILVVQDWGGPIGLLAAARASGVRFSAVCVLNTGVILPHRFRGTAFHRLARAPLLAPVLFRMLGFPLRSLERVQADRRSISGEVARAYRWPLRRLARSRRAARPGPDGSRLRGPPQRARAPRGRRMAPCLPRSGGADCGAEGPAPGRALKRHLEAFPRARVTETDAGHFLQEEVPDIIARGIRRLAGMQEGS